jgi:hypothetical protein
MDELHFGFDQMSLQRRFPEPSAAPPESFEAKDFHQRRSDAKASIQTRRSLRLGQLHSSKVKKNGKNHYATAGSTGCCTRCHVL